MCPVYRGTTVVEEISMRGLVDGSILGIVEFSQMITHRERIGRTTQLLQRVEQVVARVCRVPEKSRKASPPPRSSQAP